MNESVISTIEEGQGNDTNASDTKRQVKRVREKVVKMEDRQRRASI